MDLLNANVIEKIKRDVIYNLEKIDVESGLCRFNNRCHYNAVHDAIDNYDDFIVMCFCIDKTTYNPFIHFINIHDGLYIDNTLGNWSVNYDYYIIKSIDNHHFFHVSVIFSNYREWLQNQLPWYLRWFSDVEF